MPLRLPPPATLPALAACLVAIPALADDFHAWSDPVPDAPGEMLRMEPVSNPVVDGAAETHRILYASRDGIDDAPVAVSGLLFVPEGAAPDGGWPLVAWAHGTVGIADACAPSRIGPGAGAAAFIGRWLAEGYAVVATDYQGLGVGGPHLYLAKRPEGLSVLDSARAAIDGHDAIAGPVLISGQSQGGGAAFAAGALAPTHAPDLDVRTVMATGLPYLTADMPTASGVPSQAVDPGLAYVFYVGHVATHLEPGLAARDLFTDRAMPLFEAAGETCVGELMGLIREDGLSQAAALRDGAVAAMTGVLLEHYAYPTLDLPMPVFVGTGGQDRDVDPRGQLLLVRDACAAGTTVAARLYPDEGHAGAWRASVDDQVAFAGRVLSGETIEPQCDPRQAAGE